MRLRDVLSAAVADKNRRLAPKRRDGHGKGTWLKLLILPRSDSEATRKLSGRPSQGRLEMWTTSSGRRTKRPPPEGWIDLLLQTADRETDTQRLD
jgi:hypothetical protein